MPLHPHRSQWILVHSRVAQRDQFLVMKGSSSRNLSLRTLRIRYAPLLLRQAADLHLCCDRVIMHVVNKHACVRMCAVTAMRSVQ